MPHKILLIENDGVFASELSSALAQRGLEPRVCPDGQVGLDLARSERPDVIVLCVELPRMSGYAVCNRLKRDEELRSIPLVITSAEATSDTFEQHRKLKTRADDYLLKPFDAATLLQHVGAFIELPPEPAGNSAEVTGGEVIELHAGAGHPAAPPAELDEDLKRLDEAFDQLAGGAFGAPDAAPVTRLVGAPASEADLDAALAALSSEAGARAAGGEPSAVPADEPIELEGVAIEIVPDAGEGGGDELARLRQEVAELTAAVARATDELQAERASAEARAARDADAMREASDRTRAAEERATAAEDRASAVEQRLRREDAVREKLRRALAIALQLVDEPQPRGAPPEVQPRRE